MKRDGKGSTTPDSSGLAGAGITETAVRKATHRGWGDWYELLDAAGAREMIHPQIVAVVARYEASSWWQQMITVAYEQARGLREKHQRDDGFAANASKIVLAGITRVYGAWIDDETRAAWLDTTGWHVRKAVPYKTLRVTWTDGHTHVEVHLWPRAEGKTLVQVQHTRLGCPDEVHRIKSFWSAALDRLRLLLENAHEPHSLAA